MYADREENRGVNDVNIKTGVRHVPPQRCAPYVVLLTMRHQCVKLPKRIV